MEPFWIGIVEDRNDPDKIGRVRVRIIGFHTQDKMDLPTEDLPWSNVMQPISSAAISGIGNNNIGLVEGSTVIGIFTDGAEQQIPLVFGSIGGIDTIKSTGSLGFSDPNGKYPLNEENTGRNKLNETSFSRLSRGGHTSETHVSLATKRGIRLENIPFAQTDNFEGSATPSKTISPDTWSEPNPQGVSESLTEYPYNKINETESGHVFEVDDTPNAERIHTFHKSGSFDEIQPNGTHVQKIIGDDFELIYRDKTLYVEGNLNISVKGDANIKVEGDVVKETDGDVYEIIRGSKFTKIIGNEITDIIGDQKLNIDGNRYTHIACTTADAPINIPLIGSVPSGVDNLIVRGSQQYQVGGRKNESIGDKYILSATNGIKMTSSLGSYDLYTLEDINMATGLKGSISASGGIVNLASASVFNLDAGASLVIGAASLGFDITSGTTMTSAGELNIVSQSNINFTAPMINLN